MRRSASTILVGSARSPGLAQIRRMRDERMLDLKVHERYRHRLSSNGEALYYVAVIATKTDARAAIELVSD